LDNKLCKNLVSFSLALKSTLNGNLVNTFAKPLMVLISSLSTVVDSNQYNKEFVILLKCTFRN
jgi:hypothetical protein